MIRIAIINCAPSERPVLSYKGGRYDQSGLLAAKARDFSTDIESEIFWPASGELPRPGDHDAVIIPGSRYDIDPAGRRKHAWMEKLLALIKEAHDYSCPMLGICFGHQAIGIAFGSSIVRHPAPENGEVGFAPMMLSGHGKKDPLFKGVPDDFQGLSFHFQCLGSVPRSSIPLAFGRRNGVLQSFRLGRQTWGVQFHPDYSGKNVKELIERNAGKLPKDVDLSDVRTAIRKRTDHLVLRNFLEEVKSRHL